MKVFMKLFHVAIIFYIFLIIASFSYAGGPTRFDLNAPDGYGWTNTYVNVVGYVYDSASYDHSASVGEKVEYRIWNPRSGDMCETYGNGTTESGWVAGTCYANKAGYILIYLYSLDKGDQSNTIGVDFYEPPTPTPKPTLVPTLKPVIKYTTIPTRTPTPSPTSIKIQPTLRPIKTIIQMQKSTVFLPTKIAESKNEDYASVKSEKVKNKTTDIKWVVVPIIIGALLIVLGGSLSSRYIIKKLQ